MAGFDPSALQDIAGNLPDYAGATAKGFQLKDMVDSQQLNSLKLNKEKKSLEEDETARDVLSRSDLSTSEGLATASENLTKAGLSQRAMQLRQYGQEFESGKLHNILQQVDVHMASQNIITDGIDRIWGQAKAMKDAVGPDGRPRYTDASINAFIQGQVPLELSSVQSDSTLPPEVKKQALENINKFLASGQSVTFDTLTGLEQKSKEGQAHIKSIQDNLQRQLGMKKDETEISHLRHEDKVADERIDLERSKQTSDASLDANAKAIAEYRQAPPSSRSTQSYKLMARVMDLNPDYDQTKYNAKNRAETAFGSGKQGDTVRSLNVAIQHLDVLSDLGTKLKSGQFRTANQFYNAVGKEFGAEDITNFESAKELVGDEVVKSVLGSGAGGVSDRESLQAKFNAANSPEQLMGVIRTAKRLMAGQLSGLKRQAESSGVTGFDSKVDPQTRGALEGGNAPTATGPNGQKLVLKNGAWVPQ